MHESAEIEEDGDSYNNHYAMIALVTVSGYQKVSILYIWFPHTLGTTLKVFCVHILVFLDELCERCDKSFLATGQIEHA